jgi:hypothetical protein
MRIILFSTYSHLLLNMNGTEFLTFVELCGVGLTPGNVQIYTDLFVNFTQFWNENCVTESIERSFIKWKRHCDKANALEQQQQNNQNYLMPNNNHLPAPLQKIQNQDTYFTNFTIRPNPLITENSGSVDTTDYNTPDTGNDMAEALDDCDLTSVVQEVLAESYQPLPPTSYRTHPPGRKIKKPAIPG